MLYKFLYLDIRAKIIDGGDHSGLYKLADCREFLNGNMTVFGVASEIIYKSIGTIQFVWSTRLLVDISDRYRFGPPTTIEIISPGSYHPWDIYDGTYLMSNKTQEKFCLVSSDNSWVLWQRYEQIVEVLNMHQDEIRMKLNGKLVGKDL